MALRNNPADERQQCGSCATMLPPPATGRPSRYCSPACRQRAYRLRSGSPRNLSAAQPYWATDLAALYLGDAGTVLHRLPDESPHCIVTSPPFFNLRDYQHSDQLGLEPTTTELEGLGSRQRSHRPRSRPARPQIWQAWRDANAAAKDRP